MMYCGIDVAKFKSNVCLLDEGLNIVAEFEVEHNREGFDSLLERIPPGTKIGMEVSGSYSKAIHSFLSGKYEVSYLDGVQLSNFFRFNSPSIKNDRVDARIIALFIAKYDKKITPIRVSKLKDLCMFYTKAIAQQTRYKNMVKDQASVIFPEIDRHIAARANKSIIYLLLKYPSPKLIAEAPIEDVYNPQALNRYAYVLNNPYKYVDPSGHVNVDAAQRSLFMITNGIIFGTTGVVIGVLGAFESGGSSIIVGSAFAAYGFGNVVIGQQNFVDAWNDVPTENMRKGVLAQSLGEIGGEEGEELGDLLDLGIGVLDVSRITLNYLKNPNSVSNLDRISGVTGAIEIYNNIYQPKQQTSTKADANAPSSSSSGSSSRSGGGSGGVSRNPFINNPEKVTVERKTPFTSKPNTFEQNKWACGCDKNLRYPASIKLK